MIQHHRWYCRPATLLLLSLVTLFVVGVCVLFPVYYADWLYWQRHENWKAAVASERIARRNVEFIVGFYLGSSYRQVYKSPFTCLSVQVM